MTGKERRPRVASGAVLPALVVLGLLVLVWAATSGPVRMLSDSGRRYVFEPPETPEPPPYEGYNGVPRLRDVTKDVRPWADLSWLGDLIATTVLLLVCGAGVLALRWAWTHRWRPPAAPQAVSFEVLPERVAEALQRDKGAQLEAVEQGSPRNAIVACWLRLQEALTEAGVPPARAETSTEFVVRVLHSLDLDPAAIARLAALYREARFSEHPVGEDARRHARAALEALHAELAAPRSVQ